MCVCVYVCMDVFQFHLWISQRYTVKHTLYRFRRNAHGSILKFHRPMKRKRYCHITGGKECVHEVHSSINREEEEENASRTVGHCEYDVIAEFFC